MIIPCGHRVLVKPESVDTEVEINGTKFFIATDKKMEQAGQMFGEVISVGPQAWKAFGKDFTGDAWASVGDRVMFPRYAGVSVEQDGTEYRVMNDDDILAVVQ